MNIKLLTPVALMPSYADEGAAGMDLHSIESVEVYPYTVQKIKTGIAIELPKKHYGALVGRSGLASRGILCHYGTIDESYQGEICVILYNTTDDIFKVNAGDRIAQLIVQPYTRVKQSITKEFATKTERGEKGFGSSGT